MGSTLGCDAKGEDLMAKTTPPAATAPPNNFFAKDILVLYDQSVM